MKEKEFIENKCSKCENNTTDLCEIRQNIVGEPQCAYMKEIKIEGSITK